MGIDKQQRYGAEGGRERARRLPANKRKEIARTAALTRWASEGKVPPVLAKYGAPDRPLRIGAIEIPCYVLADGRRVLAQRGLQSGIGLSESGGKGGARRLAILLASLARNGIDAGDLIARIDSPIKFIPTHGGNAADGYEATILPDICAVFIEAGRRPGVLMKQQGHLPERAALLQHGFATVGIIALVDEATGYQEFRERDALAKILEAFVQEEIRPYIKTFSPDFYRQIYRLHGWEYTGSSARPGVIGHYTNDIVYSRLAPGVLEGLRKVTPRDQKGRLKHKLFQHLTEDIGDPRLREHVTGAIMLMKYSGDWATFMFRLDKEFPTYRKSMMLPFPNDYLAFKGAPDPS